MWGEGLHRKAVAQHRCFRLDHGLFYGSSLQCGVYYGNVVLLRSAHYLHFSRPPMITTLTYPSSRPHPHLIRSLSSPFPSFPCFLFASYILEGEELKFYQAKMNAKKSKGKQ